MKIDTFVRFDTMHERDRHTPHDDIGIARQKRVLWSTGRYPTHVSQSKDKFIITHFSDVFVRRVRASPFR